MERDENDRPIFDLPGVPSSQKKQKPKQPSTINAASNLTGSVMTGGLQNRTPAPSPTPLGTLQPQPQASSLSSIPAPLALTQPQRGASATLQGAKPDPQAIAKPVITPQQQRFDPRSPMEAIKRMATTRNPRPLQQEQAAPVVQPTVQPETQQATASGIPLPPTTRNRGDYAQAPSAPSVPTAAPVKTPVDGGVSKKIQDEKVQEQIQAATSQQQGSGQPAATGTATAQPQAQQGYTLGPERSGIVAPNLVQPGIDQMSAYREKRGQQINDFANTIDNPLERAAVLGGLERDVKRETGDFGANSGVVSALTPNGLRVNEDKNVRAQIPNGPQSPIEIIRNNPHAARSFNISSAQEDENGNFVETSATDAAAGKQNAESAKLTRQVATNYGSKGSMDALQKLMSINPKAAKDAADIGIKLKNINLKERGFDLRTEVDDFGLTDSRDAPDVGPENEYGTEAQFRRVTADKARAFLEQNGEEVDEARVAAMVEQEYQRQFGGQE